MSVGRGSQSEKEVWDAVGREGMNGILWREGGREGGFLEKEVLVGASSCMGQ